MTNAFDQAVRVTVGEGGGCTKDSAGAGNLTGGTCRGTRRSVLAANYPLLDTAGTMP